MKTLLKINWFVLIVVGTFIFISGCATGPKGKLYVNKESGFTVTYPLPPTIHKSTPFKKRNEVFRGVGAGGLPAFVINLYSEKNDFSLEKDSANDLLGALKTNDSGSNLEVSSSKDTKLADGIPAYEIIIKWDHPLIAGLYTKAIYVKKDNMLIVVSVTTTGPVSPDLTNFLYTLDIK